MKLPEVIWENIDDDDFVFKHGDYTLRVEQMRKKYWWWCVSFDKEEIAFDDPAGRTELEAKLLAERVFIKHLIEHIPIKITDSDIEAWVENQNFGHDAVLPGIIHEAMRKGAVKGAKAYRDNEIKHIEK